MSDAAEPVPERSPLSPALSALDALVDELTENQRQIAAFEARKLELLAQAVDVIAVRSAELQSRKRRTIASDLPYREVTAELAAALRVGERTVNARLSEGFQATALYPDTLEALRAGRIDMRHVTVILDAGAILTETEDRAHYEAEALSIAEQENAARLRSHAREIAARIDPDAATDRADKAHYRRKVSIHDLDDDLVRLVLDVPGVIGRAIFDRATQLAKAVRAGTAGVVATTDATATGPGAEGLTVTTRPAATVGDDADHEGADAPAVAQSADAEPADAEPAVAESADADPADAEPADAKPADPRSLDEIRADVMADLLLAATPSAHGDALAAIRAVVQVTVPLAALDPETPADRTTGPAVLAGFGPIPLDTARTLAGHTPGWERVCRDPTTGLPVAVDRYTPSARQKAYLRARDERCRFPGCMRPVVRCEVDHTLDAAKGGATCICNLAHFCKSHHIIKHHTDWTVTQIGAGVLRWTSPTGRVHLDRPPTMVRFVPDVQDSVPDAQDSVPDAQAGAPPF